MATTVKTTATITHLPVAAAVGSVVNVPNGSGGSIQVKVPAAGVLVINGVKTPILDVRAMTAATIAQFINALGIGVHASIDGNGHLTIDNVTTIAGDGDLRAFLGL